MPLALKPIPSATIENVLPPNLSHAYFENGGQHPFQPRADAFSLVNAWWLAEASLLAYADRDFAMKQFRAAGWTVDEDQPFTGESTLCYVAHSDQAVIVAFRGTQVIKPGSTPATLDALRGVLADALADVRVRMIDAEYGGPVHRGFHLALEEVWTRVAQRVSALQAAPASRRVWVTGHSLGAALATLAARRLEGVQGLYTFGSPLAGGEDFARNFTLANAFRIVNNNDIVTRVPLAEPFTLLPPRPGRRYEHVGVMKYVASDGVLQQEPPSHLQLLQDLLAGQFGHLFALGKTLSQGIAQLPDDHFNDHAPLFYALHMWNAFAR